MLVASAPLLCWDLASHTTESELMTWIAPQSMRTPLADVIVCLEQGQAPKEAVAGRVGKQKAVGFGVLKLMLK